MQVEHTQGEPGSSRVRCNALLGAATESIATAAGRLGWVEVRSFTGAAVRGRGRSCDTPGVEALGTVVAIHAWRGRLGRHVDRALAWVRDLLPTRAQRCEGAAGLLMRPALRRNERP